MKHPLVPEPMTTVTIDNKTIPVTELPQPIQHEIATLNLYHQDYVNAILAVEKADILLKYKRQQIENLIKQSLKPNNDTTQEPKSD